MNETARTSGIVVLGIGNLLLTDDGVGVHALREFSKSAPPGVVTADIGTSVLHAEYLLDSARHLLVFDAMCGGSPPGTVHVAYLSDIERRPMGDSLHNLTLRSLNCPPGAIVVGAEPELVDAGMDLTPSLAAAVPRMIEAAQHIVRRWLNDEPVALDTVLAGGAHVSRNPR